MCSEFWSGWFDKWGANHETRAADDMIAGIDEMLSKGISFSLYMTHGGTNWGHWAGANSPGFAPDVTSYDYDAPISESGKITPKYEKLRETLAKYMDGKKQAKVPDDIPTISVPAFEFTEVAPLFANLPEPKSDDTIRTMEEYDQGFGSILYRTTLPKIDRSATLTYRSRSSRLCTNLYRREIYRQTGPPERGKATGYSGMCRRCAIGYLGGSHGTYQFRTGYQRL